MNDKAKERFNKLYMDDVENITEFVEWVLKKYQFAEIFQAGDGRYWFASNETLNEWKSEDKLYSTIKHKDN